MRGTVKFFNEMKNFGFIEGEDGQDYFVHDSELEEGIRIQEDDEVEFDGEEGDRGPKAVNVTKVDEDVTKVDEDEMEEDDIDEIAA